MKTVTLRSGKVRGRCHRGASSNKNFDGLNCSIWTFLFSSHKQVSTFIHLDPNGCSSRSACSVGTDKMRSVLVWPSPPFHPCTAMMVAPGPMIYSKSALRSPNRIRLSTYTSSISCARHVIINLHLSATGGSQHPEARDTRMGNSHDVNGSV